MPSTDKSNRRQVSPQELFFEEGAWYLSAHCHLRNENRVFRLDRMSKRLYRVLKDNDYLKAAVILKEADFYLIEVRTRLEQQISHIVLEHPDEITVVSPQAFLDKITSIVDKLKKNKIKF